MKITQCRDLIDIETTSGKHINLEFRPLHEWRENWPIDTYIDSFNGECWAWVVDLLWVWIEIEL